MRFTLWHRDQATGYRNKELTIELGSWFTTTSTSNWQSEFKTKECKERGAGEQLLMWSLWSGEGLTSRTNAHYLCIVGKTAWSNTDWHRNFKPSPILAVHTNENRKPRRYDWVELSHGQFIWDWIQNLPNDLSDPNRLKTKTRGPGWCIPATVTCCGVN